MLHLEYPARPGKVIALLGFQTSATETFETWYLNSHVPAVASHPCVRGYTANLRNTKYDEEISASLGCTASDPWACGAVDELFVTSWADVRHIYTEVKLLGVYTVTEYTIRQLTTDRELGKQSPEIKRFCMLTRPHGKSREECMQYWIENHPQKCFKHHSGMAAYAQNHIENTLEDNSIALDCFASLLYWNLDALKFGHYSQPDSKQVILEDTTHFRSTSHQLTMDEFIIKK